MMTPKVIYALSAAFVVLAGCEEFENMTSPTTTKDLGNVRVDGVPYAVEERRNSERSNGRNYTTVAVWADVGGTLVYCGERKSGCAAAIREHQRNTANTGM